MSGQKCPMGCLSHGGAGVCPHCGDWHQDDFSCCAPTPVPRLTEAERDDLIRALFDEDHDCAHNMTDAYRLVERIVAERVRVVEGERDALKQQVLDEWATLVGRMTAAEARAESAEAAHRALQAELEALAAEYPCASDAHTDCLRARLRALLPGGEGR